MKPLRKLVTSLIGFDRREKRGTYILSVMLITLLVLRLVLFRPGEVPGHLPPLTGEAVTVAAGEAPPALPFNFDPNTVSYDDLLNLGLSERQARTLVNYRKSGARFRRPEDLLRVYGIDSAMTARLLPYIVIGDTGVVPVKGVSHRSAWRFESSAAGDNAADVRGPAGTTSGDGTAESKVTNHPALLLDLNRCTAEELISLPGIGSVLSVRIIRYRSLLGGFVETDQLAEVYGLDSSLVRLVAGRLTLTYDSVRALELDSVTFGDLARHPYLGYEAARQITRYRSVTASPVTLGEMVVRGVITPQQAERIAPYVRPARGTSGSDYEFILSKVLK